MSKKGIFLFFLGFFGDLKKKNPEIFLSSVLLFLPLPDLPHCLYPAVAVHHLEC